MSHSPWRGIALLEIGFIIKHLPLNPDFTGTWAIGRSDSSTDRMGDQKMSSHVSLRLLIVAWEKLR
jgi:hypothetical protein